MNILCYLDITKEDATKREKNAAIAARAAFNEHVMINKFKSILKCSFIRYKPARFWVLDYDNKSNLTFFL